MKKLLFNPKPLSKPEQVYFDMLKKRPSGLIFREVFSKAQNHISKPEEEKALIAKFGIIEK
jgi:hypothetical protein